MGSNHRRREPVDLQSTPFDHSGTYPNLANLRLASVVFSGEDVSVQLEMRLFSNKLISDPHPTLLNMS